MTTTINNSFSNVIHRLKHRKCRAWRKNWNGTKLEGDESMFITLDEIEGYLPCLTLTTPQGTQIPWLATSTDLLAEDWVIKYA